MLTFLSKPIFKFVAVPLLVIALLGAFGFGAYNWGVNSQKATQAEELIERIEGTTDAIQRGLNEVRKANPTGDAAIALDRLRSRQDSR